MSSQREDASMKLGGVTFFPLVTQKILTLRDLLRNLREREGGREASERALENVCLVPKESVFFRLTMREGASAS